MKRMLVAFTVLLLLVGLAAGASAEQPSWMQPYDEPITITFGRTGTTSSPRFPDGEAIDDNAYCDWILEQFNIKLENVWLVDADYNQKVTLAMASGTLPDIFRVNDKAQLRQLIDGRMVAPLDDALANCASDLYNDIRASYGGERALFPAIVRDDEDRICAVTATEPGYQYSLAWVRKDWLDALGLEAPKTNDDLVAIARAFVDNRMGGPKTVGFGLNNVLTDTYNGVGMPSMFYHNYNAYPGNWIYDKDGALIYGSVQPEYKEALRFLADLYAQGLIDKEYVTKDWTGSIAAGEPGITFGAWWIGAWPLADTKANDPKCEWRPYWVPCDDGEYSAVAPYPISNYFYVVNAQCAYPEVLVKLTNINAEQQNLFGIDEYDEFPKNIPSSIDTYYNGIGYTFDWGAWPINVQIRYYDQMPRLNAVWQALVAKVEAGEEIPSFATESFDGKLIVAYKNGRDNSSQGQHVYTKTLALDLMANNETVERQVYVPGVTATMEYAWSALQDMEEAMVAKIIMGDEPIDYFDTFVGEWYAQGGAQIVSEVNEEAKG